MINNVTIVGRLTKDPELKYSQSGVGVCNFTVAANRPFKSNDGQDADFINCVTFKKSAEALANFQRKGNLLGITGRIQTRNYENNEGKRVFVTEVVADSVQFLESKNKDNKPDNADKPKEDDPFKNNGKPIDITDDDLPF